MNWNYEQYIMQELFDIQNDMKLSNFNFEIEEEQSFVKRKDYNENTIYIVIKYLQDDKTVGADTQPVQFLILTEQNSLDVAKTIFDKFAESHNWKVVIENNEYIKQQYTSPVVLSNFNPVLYGYRSVMYMTSNLYVIKDLIDFDFIQIKGVRVKPINFTLTYSMNPNTQQKKTEEIASSVKSTSTLGITITIPLQSNDFVNQILSIIGEKTNGNDAFAVVIKQKEEDSAYIVNTNMKLISAQIATAVNQIPSIVVGLLK